MPEKSTRGILRRMIWAMAIEQYKLLLPGDHIALDMDVLISGKDVLPKGSYGIIHHINFYDGRIYVRFHTRIVKIDRSQMSLYRKYWQGPPRPQLKEIRK